MVQENGDVTCFDRRCTCAGEYAIGQVPITTESDGVIRAVNYPGFSASFIQTVAANHLIGQGLTTATRVNQETKNV